MKRRDLDDYYIEAAEELENELVEQLNREPTAKERRKYFDERLVDRALDKVDQAYDLASRDNGE